MKAVKLKDSVEMVGIAAIVASLIFVGMELRQSQEIAIASQYQSRIEMNLEFLDSMPEQDLRRIGERLKSRMAEISLVPEQESRFSGITPIEMGMSFVQTQKIIFTFDNGYYQYQAGFMNEESWRAIRRRSKRILGESALARESILNKSYQWRDSFVLEFGKMVQEYEDEQ